MLPPPNEPPMQKIAKTRPRDPPLLQANLQVVHRATIDGAIGVHLAVDLSQRALVELGRHSKQADEHHPDHGSRPAELNGHGHAGDVAEPHRGAQG
jgi:hypothetical protein